MTFSAPNIRNGGWGCYSENGCGEYLLIQNVLDEAIIGIYAEKYGEKKVNVDFYWLDDCVESIELGEDNVIIRWRDGETSMAGMDFLEERFNPTRFSDFYNGYLKRIRSGEKRNKYKNLMGLMKETADGNYQDSGKAGA